MPNSAQVQPLLSLLPAAAAKVAGADLSFSNALGLNFLNYLFLCTKLDRVARYLRLLEHPYPLVLKRELLLFVQLSLVLRQGYVRHTPAVLLQRGFRFVLNLIEGSLEPLC